MGNWFIKEDRFKLRLSVSEKGALSIHGEGSHDSELCWDMDDRLDTSAEVKNRIQKAPCYWKITKEEKEFSLSLPCMYQEHLASDGIKLKEMLAKSIEQPWGYINFWSKGTEFENDIICFTIIVPDDFFLQYQKLFEHVISANNLIYNLGIEFDGFRSHQLKKWCPNEFPTATQEIVRVDKEDGKEEWINFRGNPSAEEFLNGRLCFIDSVSLSIKAKDQDEI